MTGRCICRKSIRARFGWLTACVVLGLMAVVAVQTTASDRHVTFTDQEVARIFEHGPWPPEPFRNPGNPWSGEPRAVALGERLFGDPRLSTDSAMSCATCHQPSRAFTDGRERAIGWRVLERNTPTVLNVAFTQTAEALVAGSLQAQSVRPLLSPAEMNTTAAHLRRLFSTAEAYRGAFMALAGESVGALPDSTVLALTGKALAAYQETLITPRTAFDDFRDAVVLGDSAAADVYPAAARRGLHLFVGPARCSECHAGPAFTDGGFGFAGIGAGEDREVEAVPAPAPDVAPALVGAVQVRVPGLRAVSRTAPYLQDGSIPTLELLLRTHSAVPLDEAEIEDLTAFLGTL